MSARFPRPIRALLGMALVSCLGSGLTYPFLLVYLHEVRHIPLSETGLLLAVPAAVGLFATPTTGSFVDAFGARAVFVWAALTACAGSALLPTVHGAPSALIPLFLYGIGTAGIATAVNTLFAQLIPDPLLQTRAFGLNFTFVNLGLAGGAVAAAEVVSIHRPSTFTVIYLLDALSFLLPALAAFVLPASELGGRWGRRAGAGGSAAADAEGARRAAAARRRQGPHPYRQVLGNAAFLRYLVVLGAIYFVGYGAVDAGFVGFSVTVVHASPSLVADSFAVNFVVIVCLQQLTTRLVERLPRSVVLAITAAVFSAAWLVEWCAALFPGELAGRALVVAFGAIFALGEMTLSPVRNVLVNALASEELRGRYNATSWSVIQSANILAPALIGAMLGASLGGPLVLGLVVVAAAVTVAALRLGRRLSPQQDNRPSAPGTPPTGLHPPAAHTAVRAATTPVVGGGVASDAGPLA